MIGALLTVTLLPAGPAQSSPDGVEWELAEQPDGCLGCHFGAAAPSPDGLRIEGLPPRPQAGGRYPLTVVLEDPELKKAGFLLTIRSDAEPAGTLEAVDEKAEVNGPRARSTWDGSRSVEASQARWELIWTAPAQVKGELSFDLWGNVGNDDLSPLGDSIRHRVWQLPAQP